MKAAMESRDGTTFTALPHVVLDSPGWQRASHVARAFLLEMAAQLFRSGTEGGLPNGGLMVDRKRLAQRGWRSVSVITGAVRDLVACGLLVQTRKGGRNVPELFAVTWHGLACAADSYQLDIDRSAWDAAHRGSYMRPMKSIEAEQTARTAKATAARRAAAAARKNAVAGPSHDGQKSFTGPSDGQDRAAVGPSDGQSPLLTEHSLGPSNGHSLDHRHLGATGRLIESFERHSAKAASECTTT
jgi:hypothetical protein